MYKIMIDKVEVYDVEGKPDHEITEFIRVYEQLVDDLHVGTIVCTVNNIPIASAEMVREAIINPMPPMIEDL